MDFENQMSINYYENAKNILSESIDNNIKQYEDAKSLVYSEAAIELQDKSKIKMDVWGKAILEAKGNDELAKAKYIEIRIKEFEKQINKKINE